MEASPSSNIIGFIISEHIAKRKLKADEIATAKVNGLQIIEKGHHGDNIYVEIKKTSQHLKWKDTSFTFLQLFNVSWIHFIRPDYIMNSELNL